MWWDIFNGQDTNQGGSRFGVRCRYCATKVPMDLLNEWGGFTILEFLVNPITNVLFLNRKKKVNINLCYLITILINLSLVFFIIFLKASNYFFLFSIFFFRFSIFVALDFFLPNFNEPSLFTLPFLSRQTDRCFSDSPFSHHMHITFNFIK